MSDGNVVLNMQKKYKILNAAELIYYNLLRNEYIL